MFIWSTTNIISFMLRFTIWIEITKRTWFIIMLNPFYEKREIIKKYLVIFKKRIDFLLAMIFFYL